MREMRKISISYLALRFHDLQCYVFSADTGGDLGVVTKVGDEFCWLSTTTATATKIMGL